MINKPQENENTTELLGFEQALIMVKDEMQKSLSSSPAIVRHYTNHLTLSVGKFVRATSLLVSSLNSDLKIHKDAVKLAVAIEILHLATLVHDDVMDNADTRRGIITLQKKFGRKTAVICGDYLLCLSLKIAASIEKRDDFEKIELSDYFTKICLGELNQHINNGNINLTPLQYFRIISGKTAALFEASLFCGAVVAEVDKLEIAKYRKIGRYIGLIFQITDDCIDFEETVQTAKKPVQSDFEQGVITLPLIYAFNNDSELKQKAEIGRLDRAEINKAVKKTGSILSVKKVSKKYYNKCLKTIDSLDCTDVKKDKLISILDKSYYGLKA